MSMPRVALVTGLPTSFLATRVVRRLLESDPEIQLRCIVQTKSMPKARAFVASLHELAAKRVTLLEGDTASIDLGLSGGEFSRLASEVELIHHCASVTYLGASRDVAVATNEGGAREIVELALAAKSLRRLVHWSTALVSGARRGYVLEEELEAQKSFRNVIEETRFRAEAIVREAMDEVPTTILRPTTLVGDSLTGETDRLEGPYLLILLLLNAPMDLRLPIPGNGEIPLNLVPIDYVIAAGCQIARDTRAEGRCFHIIDPAPLTSRRVFELIASAAGRPLPRGSMPTGLAAKLLRAPGLDRVSQVPRGFLDQLATEVVYDDRGARELLEGSGVECPPFESYVGTMVRYVRDEQLRRRSAHGELHAPSAG
ncbi:MAG: oxidoreductase [Deltaproteobacteria bacterium]|nr:oxidoreductase [Deltaproteobacteria bacterium]